MDNFIELADADSKIASGESDGLTLLQCDRVRRPEVIPATPIQDRLSHTRERALKWSYEVVYGFLRR